MISVDNDMWTHITDTTLHLVSLLKSDPSALFCWWPTSSINQRKQADKLHGISMYSSKTQWLLWCSLCSDALMLPHMSHLLLFACPDNSADCKQTIEYQWSKLCTLWILWRSSYPSGWAEPLTHLNQMTVSTFSSLSFLCGNPSSVLLGQWIQYTPISPSIPSECFFSFCHFLRITEGIILFYLLIQVN